MSLTKLQHFYLAEPCILWTFQNMLNTDQSVSIRHKRGAFGDQILNLKCFERSTWLLNSSQIHEHFYGDMELSEHHYKVRMNY